MMALYGEEYKYFIYYTLNEQAKTNNQIESVVLNIKIAWYLSRYAKELIKDAKSHMNTVSTGFIEASNHRRRLAKRYFEKMKLIFLLSGLSINYKKAN